MRFFALLSLIVLTSAASLPVLAVSTLIGEDAFDSNTSWLEVANYQHQTPHLPCRGPDTSAYHWNINGGTAELDINHSVPCTVVAVPNFEPQGIDQPVIKVAFDWQPLTRQQDRNWLLRWQDADNYLGFHIFDNMIYLEKRIAGVNYSWENTRQRYVFTSEQWYHVELIYEPESHLYQIFVDGALIWQTKEPPEQPQLLSGKPGLMGSVGAAVPTSHVLIDNWQWWQSDRLNVMLPVPSWMQTDPTWGTDIYDQAEAWAQSEPATLARWGCALTAAATVAHFHGVTTLPDGTPLDPGTLNAWLKDQPDGYWPEGMLNWRAISRLSAERAKNAPGEVQLEFAYASPTQPLAWLQEQLDRQLPAILAVPNHFITATGYLPNPQDSTSPKKWWIHDPFYVYHSLETYGNTFQSARLFTPSHTDLSAITIITPGSWQLLSEEGHEEPYAWETSPPGNRWKVYDFPKPDTGNHYWQLLPSNHGSQATIQTYTQAGEVVILEKTLSEATQWTIEVDNNHNLMLTPQSESSSPLHLGWRQMLQQSALRSPFIGWQCESIAARSSDCPFMLDKVPDMLIQLENLSQRKWIEPLAYQELRQRLEKSLAHCSP